MAQAQPSSGPKVLPAGEIAGFAVHNQAGERLGQIKDLVVDLAQGRIAYAVLSFGGFLGLGDKLFAVPWAAFAISAQENVMYLNVAKDKLDSAPGFDKNAWPNFADQTLNTTIRRHYGYPEES